MSEYKTFHTSDYIYKTIQDLGFKEMTPIQEQVIPLMRKHQDVIGISQTGTGKTHAFLIPLLERINLESNKVQAVIMAPTRELAEQLNDCVREFIKHEPRLTCQLLIGGKDRQKAIQKLNTQPMIVIGTPGRLKDLSLDEQALHITTADLMIIDEADMCLDLGYYEDIDAIAGKMKEDLNLCVFSATIPMSLRPFLKKYMHLPRLVEIEAKQKASAQVEHVLVWTRHRERYVVLREIMNVIDPYLCIIFCNTRKEASEISHQLLEEGLKVGEIHGDLEPRERRAMMRRIKNNEYQYIVATDIAARGLDIDGASHIINMGFPSELDFYIHRSGRTGRGSYTGYCYSLYDSSDENVIRQLSKRGIQFVNRELKNGQWNDIETREKRNSRPREQTELEKEITKIVKKPTKVKPGYKKKRQRAVNELVRKQKRQMIKQDIKRQQKERARKAQAERSRMARGEIDD